MGSFMAHLNWFLLGLQVSTTGSSCKIRDVATQDGRWNEREKLRIFREIAKWRRWRHAPRLTATAVIMDSHHRFSTRCQVANVKNIAGDDQTTLMVHRNSTNIACPFRFYICLRLRDRYCCSAADGSGSCYAPAPSYIEEITRCQRKKLDWRWPDNPNSRTKFRNLGLFTFTQSQRTLRRRLRGFWRLLETAQTTEPTSKTSPGWPGSIEIPQIQKCMHTKSSKTSWKTSFSCYECRRDWRHCALCFSCYHWQRLLFSHSKNNFSTTLTHTEKPRYTYCRIFCRFYL